MATRTCADMREQISAWLDGELTPDSAALVRSHVADCPQCQRVVESYRSISISIRDLPPVTPPVTLAEDILARTVDAGPPRLLWRGSRIGYGFASIAAVLALFVVAGYLLVGGYQRSIEPNVASSMPGQEDVWPIHRPIRITFNKAMDHDSVIAALAIAPAGEADRLGTAWDDQTLVIGGEQLLKPDTTYTIRITTKAEDTWGNNLNQPYELRFTTTTTVPAQLTPTPTATAPASPTATASPTAEASATPTDSTTDAPAATRTPATPDSNGPGAGTPTATTTPSSTATPSTHAPTSTPGGPAPTATLSLPPATATPDTTGDGEPTATATATVSVPPTATNTPQPTPTATVPPTNTPQPTATSTPTATATAPVATETPQPPATQTPSTVPVVGAIGSIYWNNPAVQDRLGVALARETQVDTQLQGFQRADMLYRSDTNTIYVLPTSGLWSSYVNTANVLPEPQSGPEEGTWQPGGIIGALWAAEQSVSNAAGYAISEDALGYTGAVQTFEGGVVLVSPTSIYIVFDAGDWEFYPNTGESMPAP